MLTHTIIVEKPLIQLPAVQHRPNNAFAGAVTTPWGYEKSIKDQYELDVFLETKPVVGEIVTFTSFHELVDKPWQIHYIAKIESDFGCLTFDSLGQAKTHFLMQLSENYNKPNPWHRWVTIKDFRRITNEEREAMGAELQNYIQRAKDFADTHS